MEMKIWCDIDTALLLTSSKQLSMDFKQAKYQAEIYYLEEMIHKHFELKDPNSRYEPNSIKYRIWKNKYKPNLPQLVVSGRLRNAVLNGKVNRTTGQISFNLPEWGLWQIKAGRDFLTPDKVELKKINNRIRRNLFYIRQLRAKAAAKFK